MNTLQYNQLKSVHLSSFYERFKTGNGCWEWSGYKNSKGYGRLSIYVNGTTINTLAHRLAYFLNKGYINERLVVDHVCRNPSCVNPAHLRQITNEENLAIGKPNVAVVNALKTHCKYGHEFTPENTKLANQRGRKFRQCITCTRKKGREYQAKLRKLKKENVCTKDNQ